MPTSRLATHDSGPGWLAKPFLYDSFIHNSTPVCTGALSTLLELPRECVDPAKRFYLDIGWPD
jgi:hypothetical protein